MQETWETWVQSLGWDDPLEKENGNPLQYSWWRVSWTEEPGGLPFSRSQRIIHNWMTKHDWWSSWITKWVKEEIERKWRNTLTKKGSTTYKTYACMFSRLVLSDSESPWTVVLDSSGCHALLQGIFLSQGLKPHLLCLLYCRQIPYPLNNLGSPRKTYGRL